MAVSQHYDQRGIEIARFLSECIFWEQRKEKSGVCITTNRWHNKCLQSLAVSNMIEHQKGEEGKSEIRLLWRPHHTPNLKSCKYCKCQDRRYKQFNLQIYLQFSAPDIFHFSMPFYFYRLADSHQIFQCLF